VREGVCEREREEKRERDGARKREKKMEVYVKEAHFVCPPHTADTVYVVCCLCE